MTEEAPTPKAPIFRFKFKYELISYDGTSKDRSASIIASSWAGATSKLAATLEGVRYGNSVARIKCDVPPEVEELECWEHPDFGMSQ